MTVSIPAAENDTWFSFTIEYDSRVLTCTLYWCEEIQSLYDKLSRQLVLDASNDPIMPSDGRIIRDYDILEYYQVDNPVVDVVSFNKWRDTHELTASLSRFTYDYMLQREVIERSIMYYEIVNKMKQLHDMMVWTFTISDEDEDVTGVIRPGSYYTRAGYWDLWVRSEHRTEIGRDDLQFVTMELV